MSGRTKLISALSTVGIVGLVASLLFLLLPSGVSAIGIGEVSLSNRLTSDFENFEFSGESGLAEISYVGVHKGKVQIIIRMYLDKTDPNYDKTLVYIIDGTSEEFLAGYPESVDKLGDPRNQKKYDEWIGSLPHIWQNNPYHNHVLYFDADVADEEIKARIAESSNYFYNFYLYCWAGDKVFMEEWVKVPGVEGTIRAPFVKGSVDEGNLAACQVKANDIASRLDNFKTTKAIASTNLNIGDKGTIDIGAAATDRATTTTIDDRTRVGAENPANASGSITSVEIWLNAEGGTNDVWAGTFSASGNVLTCRDSESIGSIAVGSKQTVSGLDITVVSGDYLGTHAKQGQSTWIERDNSGSGYWYVAAECIDPTDSMTFTWLASRTISLYGTGTEPGCSPDISNTPSSKAFGVVSASTSYWSKGSAPTFPLDDAECHFTVTNNSGGAVSITVKATNFTGGVGWTLTSGAPGENTVRLRAGKSGDANEAAMVVLTTGEQAFISALADSGTKKWELKMETPTSFTDGVEKTSTVTLTATCD